MADIPPPPPGFTLVEPPAAAAAVPPPPPGFTLVEPTTVGNMPPPPAPTDDGFRPPPLQMAPADAPEGLRIDMTKKPPSLVDQIVSGGKTALRYGTQAAAGAREGTVNIAGLPVDMVSAIYNVPAGAINYGLDAVGFGDEQLNLGPGDQISAPPQKGPRLPIVSKPVGGGEFLNDLFPTAPKPKTYGERLTRRVSQEVGAAAVPITYGIAKGAQVGVEGARQLNPLARTFAEPGAIAPGKFATKEFAGATAAGGAAHTAGEFSGKNRAEAEGKRVTTGQAMADMAAATGGYGLASTGTRMAGMGSDVLGAVFGTHKTTNKTARDLSVDEFVRAAGLQPNPKGVTNTAPLAKELDVPNRAFDPLTDYRPTTAELLANEGLAGKEYSRSITPEASGRYKQASDANTRAVDNAMEANAPNGQPGVFKHALAVERDRLATEAETAVQPLKSTTTRGERGNTIRAEVDAAHGAARKATQDAYEAADVNSVPLAPTFLAEALDRTTAGLSRAERSMAPQADIKAIAEIPAGETTTLREATSLRTKLIDQQSAALADPGRRYEARVLGQYIEAIEDVIGQSVSAEQRGLLDQARAARRAQADAFELRGDPVAQIGARYKGGNPVRSDENVGHLARKDETIGRLLEEADTPATRQAIRQELLSDVDTDSAVKIEQFQKDYAQQIARFPGLADELATAAKARAAEPAPNSAVASYLKYGDENAERAMRSILGGSTKDPVKAIDELLNFAGNDKAAVNGARKVFWDILKADNKRQGQSTGTVKGNVQPYLPGDLQKFLDDPVKAGVMERLYRDNPEHLENIRKVAEAMQNIDVRAKGRATGSSGTTQGMKSILPSPEVIGSRGMALQRGQVGPLYLGLNMIAIIGRRAIANRNQALIGRITDEMLLNPEFASLLLKENNPANRAAMSRGARGFLGNEASTLTQMLQDDPDEDVKGAVMRSK
jgi:hypothetical protein